MPGLVLLQLGVKPLILAERHDLGFPDAVEVEELTGVDVVGLLRVREEPPGSPWMWWCPDLSGLKWGPPDHTTGWLAGATNFQSVITSLLLLV
jgi:hypothetical protein